MFTNSWLLTILIQTYTLQYEHSTMLKLPEATFQRQRLISKGT